MTNNVDFIAMLSELKNGKAAIDCARKLSELVDAISEHRKKGKLSLEIAIEPSGLGDDGRVVETSISWTCKITKPEADTGRSIFFVTRDNRLTRNDPDQADLFEEVVTIHPGEIVQTPSDQITQEMKEFDNGSH